MATPDTTSRGTGGSHFAQPEGTPTKVQPARPASPGHTSASHTGAFASKSALTTSRVSSRTAAATRRAAGGRHGRETRGGGGSQRRLPRVLIAVIGTLAIAVAVAFVVVPAIFPSSDSTQDSTVDLAPTGTEVTITIPDGSGAAAVAQVLYENGLISDSSEFLNQVRRADAEQSLKSGSYAILAGTDIPAIIQLLMAGPNVTTAGLTIPEGYTVAQVAQAVEESLGVSADDFLAQAKASNYVSDYPFLAQADNDSLEGFLFPKTYDFSAEDEVTADLVIRTMLDQFVLETQGLDLDAAAATLSSRFGVTIDSYDIVTMASIVEREAVTDDQRGPVASVFYNRLAAGMRIQSDATLTYSLGHAPSADELQTLDDPYNTYFVDGLTPTPICSPSLASIEAAVNPPDTDYYYFYITQDDAQFSETYDEHQQTYS